MTDRRVHHHRRLHSVPATNGSERPTVAGATPSGVSLDFTYIASASHFERGQWMAAVEALCDALEMYQHGGYEPISNDRFNHHMRLIRGNEWVPKGAA